MLPGLPDLAVLARNDEPSRSLRAGRRAFSCESPVSVQVRLSDRDDELMAEFPSESMPRVHFGEGPGTLLCYQLSEPALRFAWPIWRVRSPRHPSSSATSPARP